MHLRARARSLSCPFLTCRQFHKTAKFQFRRHHFPSPLSYTAATSSRRHLRHKLAPSIPASAVSHRSPPFKPATQSVPSSLPLQSPSRDAVCPAASPLPSSRARSGVEPTAQPRITTVKLFPPVSLSSPIRQLPCHRSAPAHNPARSCLFFTTAVQAVLFFDPCCLLPNRVAPHLCHNSVPLPCSELSLP